MKRISKRGLLRSLSCIYILFILSTAAINPDEEDELLEEVIPHHLSKRKFYSPSKRQFIQPPYGSRDGVQEPEVEGQMPQAAMEQLTNSNEQTAGIPDQTVTTDDQSVGPGQLEQGQGQPSVEQLFGGSESQSGLTQQLSQVDPGSPHTVTEETKNYDPNSVTELALNDNSAYKVTTDVKEKANRLASDVKDFGLWEYSADNTAQSTDQTAKMLQSKLLEDDKAYQGKDSASLNVNQLANAQGSKLDGLLDLFNQGALTGSPNTKGIDSLESATKGLEAYDSATKGFSAIDAKGERLVSPEKGIDTSNIDGQSSEFSSQQGNSPSDVSVVNLPNNYAVEDDHGNSLGPLNTGAKQGHHANTKPKMIQLMKALLKEKLRTQAAKLFMKNKHNPEGLSNTFNPLKRIANLLANVPQNSDSITSTVGTAKAAVSNTDLKLLSFIKQMLNGGSSDKGISEQQMKMFMSSLKESVGSKDGRQNKQPESLGENKDGSTQQKVDKETDKDSAYKAQESKSEKLGASDKVIEKVDDKAATEASKDSKDHSKNEKLQEKLKAIKAILKQVKPTVRSGHFYLDPEEPLGNTGTGNSNSLMNYLEHETALVDQFQEGSQIGDPARQLKHLAQLMMTIANKAKTKEAVVDARRTTVSPKQLVGTVKSKTESDKQGDSSGTKTAQGGSNDNGDKTKEASSNEGDKEKEKDSNSKGNEGNGKGQKDSGKEQRNSGNLEKEDKASSFSDDITKGGGSKASNDIKDDKKDDKDGQKDDKEGKSDVKDDKVGEKNKQTDSKDEVKENKQMKEIEKTRDNSKIVTKLGKDKEEGQSKTADENQSILKETKSGNNDNDNLNAVKKPSEVSKLRDSKKIVEKATNSNNDISEFKEAKDRDSGRSDAIKDTKGPAESSKLSDDKKLLLKIDTKDENSIAGFKSQNDEGLKKVGENTQRGAYADNKDSNTKSGKDSQGSSVKGNDSSNDKSSSVNDKEKTRQGNQGMKGSENDADKHVEGNQRDEAMKHQTTDKDGPIDNKQELSGHISPQRAVKQGGSANGENENKPTQLSPQLPFLNPGKAHLDVLESDKSLKQYLMQKGRDDSSSHVTQYNQSMASENFDNDGDGKLLHVKDVTGTAKEKISVRPEVTKTHGATHRKYSSGEQRLVPPAGQGFPWDSKAHSRHTIRPISRSLLKKYRSMLSHLPYNKHKPGNEAKLHQKETGSFRHIGPELLSQLNDASVRYAALARLISMAKERAQLIDVAASKKTLPEKAEHLYVKHQNEVNKPRERVSVKFYSPIVSTFYKNPQGNKAVLVPTRKSEAHEIENAVLVPDKNRIEPEPAVENSRLTSRVKSAEIDSIIDPSDVTRSQLGKPEKPSINQVMDILGGKDDSKSNKKSLQTSQKVSNIQKTSGNFAGSPVERLASKIRSELKAVSKIANMDKKKVAESGAKPQNIEPDTKTRIRPIDKPQNYQPVHEQESGKGFIRKKEARDIIRTLKTDTEQANFLLKKRSKIPKVKRRNNGKRRMKQR